MSLCPCGSGQPYARCCAPLHEGAAATSAEALMRSRYSAFALGRADYLRQSWHASTRPETLQLEADVKWLGLRIEHHRSTGPDSAIVRFIARWRQGGGSAQRLAETSRFLLQDGHWFYLDAEG